MTRRSARGPRDPYRAEKAELTKALQASEKREQTERAVQIRLNSLLADIRARELGIKKGQKYYLLRSTGRKFPVEVRNYSISGDWLIVGISYWNSMGRFRNDYVYVLAKGAKENSHHIPTELIPIEESTA